MKRYVLTAFASLFTVLTACGSKDTSESRLLSRIQRNDIIVETFESTLKVPPPTADELLEIHRAIEGRQSQIRFPTDSTVNGSVLEDATGDRIDTITRIINAFADIMKKVVAPDTPLMKGHVIAEARPAGLDPMALQNSKYAGKSYKKLFKSLLGFKLVEVEYKITYAYAADNAGKGQYIPHVLFTPMKIVLDPLWHLEGDSLSLTPRNCGTLENPIAALEFNLAFKAKGLTGTVMAADTFSLNGQTGELVADGRDFQP